MCKNESSRKICFMGVLIAFCLHLGLSIGVCAVKIDTPKWLKAVPVADEMVINGLSSVVHYFKVDRSKDDVLEFYRNAWEVGDDGRTPGYREVRADFWHVVSRLEDKRYLLTVQVKSLGPFISTGYLAVGDLKKMKRKNDPGQGVPKMHGSHVANDLTSYDPGKKGRTLMVVNDNSMKSNVEYYRNYYKDRSWSQLIDLPQQGGHVLAYSRSGEEAHFVISENYDKTQIVINIIENL